MNSPFESPDGSGRYINLTEIHEPWEFSDWVRGTLWDAAKDEGGLQDRGLYVIGDIMTRTYTYETDCTVPPPPAVPQKPEAWLNGSNLSNYTHPVNATGDDSCVGPSGDAYTNDGSCDVPCGGETGLCDVGCVL